MKIAIRVDASIEIGTGHFMRCLALATSMKKRGFQVTFISRDLPVHFAEVLGQKGITLFSLRANETVKNNDGLMHSHWLKVSLEN